MTRRMQKSDTTAPEDLPIQQKILYSCAMAIQYEKRYLVLARATGSLRRYNLKLIWNHILHAPYNEVLRLSVKLLATTPKAASSDWLATN